MSTTRTVGGVSWNFNAAATASMEAIHKSGAVTESVFESVATLSKLRNGKFKEIVEGGNKIRVDVMLGKNTGVSRYNGFELVNVDPQDGITAGFYDKAHYSVPLSISREEQNDNRGKAKIFDLVKEKAMQQSMSLQEEMLADIFDAVGTAAAPTYGTGKALIPLGGLISKTPTSGLVGLIDRATETAWRNKTKDGSGYTTFVLLKQGITNMMIQCSKGAGGAPNLAIADPVSWQGYHDSMQEQVRYTSKEKATIGFESLAIGLNCEFIWDTYVPDMNAGSNGGPTTTLTNGSIFFINSKFMHFGVVKGEEFASTEFVRPANQLASTALMLFSGQLYASALRKHGLIYKLPVSWT